MSVVWIVQEDDVCVDCGMPASIVGVFATEEAARADADRHAQQKKVSVIVERWPVD